MYFLSIISVIFSLICATSKPRLPASAQTLDLGFTVHIANVGQGNGVIVVDNTQHKKLIVDAGSSSNPSTPEETRTHLEQCFNMQKQHKPAHTSSSQYVFVVSHPDEDHMSFFSKSHFFKSQKQWFENPISKFYLGGSLIKYLISKQEFLEELLNKELAIVSCSHAVNRPLIKQLLAQAKQSVPDDGYLNEETALTRGLRDVLIQNVRPVILRSIVPEFSEGGRFKTEIVIANAGHSDVLDCQSASTFEDKVQEPREMVNLEDNTSSVVVRLSFYNDTYSILLPGDATGITTDRILFHYRRLNRIQNLRSKLVLACHHGAISEESNNPDWVRMLEPESVIFSSGCSYHHPLYDALLNYLRLPSLKAAASHEFVCAREKTRPAPDHFVSGSDDERYRWYKGDMHKSVYSTRSSGHITLIIMADKTVLNPQNVT